MGIRGIEYDFSRFNRVSAFQNLHRKRDAGNVSRSWVMKTNYNALNSGGVFASLSDGLINKGTKP